MHTGTHTHTHTRARTHTRTHTQFKKNGALIDFFSRHNWKNNSFHTSIVQHHYTCTQHFQGKDMWMVIGKIDENVKVQWATSSQNRMEC